LNDILHTVTTNVKDVIIAGSRRAINRRETFSLARPRTKNQPQ